jgi:hypothetical protein
MPSWVVKEPLRLHGSRIGRQNSVGQFSLELERFGALPWEDRTLGGAAWVPLELTEETKHERRIKGSCNKGLSAYGSSRWQANLFIYNHEK